MRNFVILSVLLATSYVVNAQNDKEYNIRGDEALAKLDYSAAIMWYQDGAIEFCDLYSIDKLITIWYADESMRQPMRSVMSECIVCLEKRVDTEKDTESLRMLIRLHTEGIGTPANATKARQLKERLEALQKSNAANGVKTPRSPADNKNKVHFFAGYSASIITPFGLTVGGVGQSVGAYLRVRSNLSFQDYTLVCDHAGMIAGYDSPHRFTDEKKVNVFMGSGGLMVKLKPQIYLSIGAGYFKHETLLQFQRINEIETKPEDTFWAKSNVKKYSFDGVVLDVDGTCRIGKNFYGTAGCSLLNFNYACANVGLGLFF